MEEIPEILRSDSFRQLMRDDLDFRQIKHKSILKKEQKFTDGMTQLMLNVIDKWQNHSRYSDTWNATKLSRDFQRQVCSTDQKSFCDVLERNGFVIDHQFFQPTLEVTIFCEYTKALAGLSVINSVQVNY